MATKYWRGGATTDKGAAAGKDGDIDFEGTTYAITSCEEGIAGQVDLVCADFGTNVVVGQKVTVTGTTIYDGHHTVMGVIGTTKISIVETWVDTQTGNALSHNDSNWVDAAGIGTVKPAAADTIIFSDRAGIVSIASTDTQTKGKHWSVDAGLDQKGINFAAIVVEAGFTAKFIGYRLETTSPVTRQLVPLQCACDLVLFKGESEMHLAANDNVDPAVDLIDEVIIDSTKGSVYLYSVNNSGTQTDEITDVLVREGTAHIVSGYDSTAAEVPPGIDTARAAVRNLKLMGSKAYATVTEGQVTPADGNFIDADNDQYISIEVIEGICYCDSCVYVATIHDGQLDIGSVNQTAGTTLTVGEQYSGAGYTEQLRAYGGVVNWRSKGTLGGLEIHAAAVMAIGNEDRIAGSTALDPIELYGGSLDLSAPDGGVALGGSCTVYAHAGNFYPPKRSSISW